MCIRDSLTGSVSLSAVAVVFSAAAACDFGGESREVQRLVPEGAKVPSALELGLYRLPFIHRDNRLVGVLDEILRHLTVLSLIHISSGRSHRAGSGELH